MAADIHTLRFTLRFSEKLHSQKDFKRVLTLGRRLAHPALFIYLHRSGQTPERQRMGLITSRKVGIAADRNRIKRRLREIFRLNKHRLEPGIDVIFIPKKDAVLLNYQQLETIVFSLLQEAKVFT